MYTLHGKTTAVCLSDDLEMLEFFSSGTVFRADSPFQLNWTGIPVTARNMRFKKLTRGENQLTIAFGQPHFAARFPGNSYCRPGDGYAPDFRFSVTLKMEGDDLIVQLSPVENLGDNFLSLQIAQNLLKLSSAAPGSLVLPVNHGLRLDLPRQDTLSENALCPSVNWSLPVHGLFRADGGIGLWCEDFDRDYSVQINCGTAKTAAAFCRQLYHPGANGSREMRFMLFPAGAGFLDLGRRCRELRQSSGRFKTLAQKMEEDPEVAQLPGTVFWKHNVYYRKRPAGVEKDWSLYVARPEWNGNEGKPNNWTAEEIFSTAAKRGFDRVLVCNTGWNRDGFDAGYPDRLPPNPERGTVEEFKAAALAAKKRSPGYTLSVHDNYIDVYQAEGFKKEEVAEFVPGVPAKGGIWRGGQAFKLCSDCAVKYARRDLPEIAKLTGRGGIYLDVNAGVPLYCCQSKLHPVTRREDWENRREIFRTAKRHFGALAVEGCGTDHFADLIDIGAYGGFFQPFLFAGTGGSRAVPVPLWETVYHDSVLGYVGEGYGQMPLHGEEYRLYQALYTLLPTSFDEHSKKISFELRKTCTTQLVNFFDLIPRTVEGQPDGSCRTRGAACSVYGDGTQIVANFDDQPLFWQGQLIPPRDFLILRH